MVLYVLHFYFLPCLPGQDHDLTHDIRTAEVEARIRLGIAFLLCLTDHFREGSLPVVVIENEVEGSA